MMLPSLFTGLASLAYLQTGLAAPAHRDTHRYCAVQYTETPRDCLEPPESFLPFSSSVIEPLIANSSVLKDAVEALVVLQEHYFDTDYATWPSSIDWTAAVVGTIVSGTLTTLSKSLAETDLSGSDWKSKENFISSYFAQIVGSYYGQDVLSLRGEAYDDILWVVLGWIETIKFVRTHADLHYSKRGDYESSKDKGLKEIIESIPWYGNNWVPSFAHRARIFWNLGSKGWETRLCGGGMMWNPRLVPYKNSITNELWIAASISMYQDFPGDNFTAPWLNDVAFPTKDPKHLTAAFEGYWWLRNVNMTNHRGLFVDGYHIDNRIPGNTRCDLRDEMVYTYNQGVLLTGQRGLWAVTGDPFYLDEGHKLIQSVIAATGWDIVKNIPVDDLSNIHVERLPPWRGIGRGGILEEQCDASGTCSQDGQTFKGIFFHHLATFCAPLDPISIEKGMTVDMRGYHRIKLAHSAACKSYLGWIKHNAVAALKTRDKAGRFGMWWGAGLWDIIVTRDDDGINHDANNTTDYRNQGTPDDVTWGKDHRWLPGTGGWKAMREHIWLETDSDQHVLSGASRHDSDHEERVSPVENSHGDPNERGRGRTVETQTGGLALLRAYWDISQLV